VAKRREKLAPKTIANHLRTLSAMFEYARRRRRMTLNPVGLLEPLSVPTPDTPVLREEEIAALLNAYRLLEEAAEPAEVAWWALARRLTAFALGTALRRCEILALRWSDVEMLERRLHVRRALVRGELGKPKSKAGRRTIGYGPRTADVLDEQFQTSLYRSPESLVFCHPQLGTPLDPSKLSGYMRKAIKKAGIERPIRPWHDLRHTALTHDAAAGNPAVYVEARAGHAQATMTERYVHAAQVAFPGQPSARRSGCSAACQAERGTNSGTKRGRLDGRPLAFAPHCRSFGDSPGWTRTNNPPVNSRMLCQLSYRGTR
jgi:integrase